jgi:hypothetical protein
MACWLALTFFLIAHPLPLCFVRRGCRAGFHTCRYKVKAVCLIKLKRSTTRYEGAWVERGYSSYSFSTSALDGDEWSASRPGRALPLGKGPSLPNVQEAGWAPEPVWTQRLEEKILSPLPGIEPRSPGLQPVARHYTAWATRLTLN